MFFKRLMGASSENRGEVIHQVNENLWQATPSGTLFWLVEPDLCQSSTGVYYRRTGLNVYGSDGNWYSSLDVLDEQTPSKDEKDKTAAQSGSKGCLVVLALMGLVAWLVMLR